MRSGVLCRLLVQPRAFHRPIPPAPMLPKEHRCECQLARAAPSTHPLRSAKLTTQNTFDWIDPDLAVRSSRALFRRFVLSASRPGHPFHGTQLPALPRFFRSPKPATPRSNSLGPKPEEAFTRRRCLSPISAINLLSRAPAKRLNSRVSGLRLYAVPFPLRTPNPHEKCEQAIRRRPRPCWFAASGITSLERQRGESRADRLCP